MKRRPPAVHVADSDTFELREEAVVRGLVPLAHVYYSVALRAAHQGVAFDAGPVEWNRAPYIAVFFAFAAAEAYLPELHRSPTATQAQGLDKTKLKPAITPWKAQKALEVAYAAGEPNAGSLDWYKGLRCLRILRNELVHFKAQAHRLDEWPPRLLKADCRSVGRSRLGGRCARLVISTTCAPGRGVGVSDCAARHRSATQSCRGTAPVVCGDTTGPALARSRLTLSLTLTAGLT